MADKRLRQDHVSFPDIRTGNGYDVHSFEPGDHVTLCGVKIPHEAKLTATGRRCWTSCTDRRPACDARKGRYIGTHLGPSDPQWKGAASRILSNMLPISCREAGGRIANVDVTFISEAIEDRPTSRSNGRSSATCWELPLIAACIKATTNESYFVGRQKVSPPLQRQPSSIPARP